MDNKDCLQKLFNKIISTGKVKITAASGLLLTTIINVKNKNTVVNISALDVIFMTKKIVEKAHLTGWNETTK